MSNLLDILNDTKVNLEINSEKSIYPSIKSLLALILIFIFVTSDIFVNNFLILLGDTTVDKNKLKLFGIIVQGIVMVLLFMLTIYAFNNNYL